MKIIIRSNATRNSSLYTPIILGREERERERGKVIMATVVMMTHLLELDAVRLNEISEAVIYHFCEIMIEF